MERDLNVLQLLVEAEQVAVSMAVWEQKALPPNLLEYHRKILEKAGYFEEKGLEVPPLLGGGISC